MVGVLVGVFAGVLVGVLVAVLTGVLVGVRVAVFVGVLVATVVTTRVPLPEAVPDWQVPPPFPARTVKVIEPAGVVPAVVVMVRVEVAFPPVLVTEVGLNDALVPAGKAELMLNGEVHELPFPLKLTVTV